MNLAQRLLCSRSQPVAAPAAGPGCHRCSVALQCDQTAANALPLADHGRHADRTCFAKMAQLKQMERGNQMAMCSKPAPYRPTPEHSTCVTWDLPRARDAGPRQYCGRHAAVVTEIDTVAALSGVAPRHSPYRRNEAQFGRSHE